MREIRVAIVGVGNCASSLTQGIEYYARGNPRDVIGLMHYDICGYTPEHINVVAAFDVDKRKVGRPFNEAIFAAPNCTKVIMPSVQGKNVFVSMGHPLDGISPHMAQYPESRTFVLADKKPEDVTAILKERNVDILLNYVPVGSEKATRFYAECCLASWSEHD